ncbi:MAG: ParB/RepB/Spo0J family partition protein [Rhodospirillaceae bacterium]|nr:ParB/RepB/Spo0J family partition protein [Rhodospirillaceae bacterium]
MTGKSPQRRSLGRGLDALLGAETETQPEPAPQSAPAVAGRAPVLLPIGNLTPGKFQPRRRFVPEEIEALTQSIREKGILQPVLVRPLAGEPGKYEIVAGERRWRAAQQAQLHEIPALVRELEDRDTLEVALVENLQRQDLSPLEEARGYQRMIDEFARTQGEVAQVVGKSRPHVANMLRLLTLPARVQEMLDDGRLSAGHARSLVGLEAADAVAERIAAQGLSVREAEQLAQRVRDGGADALEPKHRAAREDMRSPDIVALERDVSERLGLLVHIKGKGEAGEVTIRYKNLEQLDDLLNKLRR